MSEHRNVLAAFWKQVATRADHPALVQKRNGQWQPMTWGTFGEKVARLTSALRALGLGPGEKFAIFSDNCQEWFIADYAAMSADLVSVPIYPNLTADQVRYIVEHSEAKAAFVRRADRLGKLDRLRTLQKIITFECLQAQPIPPGLGEKCVSFEDFIRGGSPDPEPHVRFAANLDVKKIATISYTSGTTAHPKGVLLSHENIIFQTSTLGKKAARNSQDVVLSFLPLSHIAERLNQFRQAAVGYTVYFGEGLESLGKDLKEVRPTSFMAVPRVYEKFHEAIEVKFRSAPEIHKSLLKRSARVGKDYLRQKQQKRVSPITLLQMKALQFVVGGKIRSSLGLDRCRHFFSGAAPLDTETGQFFFAFGMPISEAYGLTECAGASHMNEIGNPAFGTVGLSLEGIQCRIADDGEILIKGANVFAGYFNDPESTRDSVKDGWLHTGDIGCVDSNGNLRITDRKKNIIVTAAGKNIAPAPLEAKIRHHPMVSQAVVIGDRRKYLTALVTLKPGFTPGEAFTEIQQHLNQINSGLPSYETLKNFSIIDKDFGIESGELTPTMKIKRSVIQTKYKSVIEGMYGPGDLRS